MAINYPTWNFWSVFPQFSSSAYLQDFPAFFDDFLARSIPIFVCKKETGATYLLAWQAMLFKYRKILHVLDLNFIVLLQIF